GPGRAIYTFWHSRTWHGRDHERHGRPWRHHSVRRHVSDLLGLHAAVGAPRELPAAARDLPLQARFDLVGRRWADPPTDRTAIRSAGDSELHAHSASGCQ